MKKPIILPAVLALALASTAACTSSYAQAPAAPSQPTAQQPGDAPQNAQQRDHMTQGRRDVRHHRLDFAARAEGRIAYVKAALKITPAQQAFSIAMASDPRQRSGQAKDLPGFARSARSTEERDRCRHAACEDGADARSATAAISRRVQAAICEPVSRSEEGCRRACDAAFRSWLSRPSPRRFGWPRRAPRLVSSGKKPVSTISQDIVLTCAS